MRGKTAFAARVIAPVDDAPVALLQPLAGPRAGPLHDHAWRKFWALDPCANHL